MSDLKVTLLTAVAKIGARLGLKSSDSHADAINTGGAPYVEGKVKVHGDYIHGNKTVYTTYPEASTGTGKAESESKAYFLALAAECAELPLGKIDENFIGKNGVISLKDVYIDLDVFGVRLDRKKDPYLLKSEWERPKEGRENRRIPLIDVIEEQEMRRIVLLGVAGSGKTTFTNYLTYALANAYIKGLDDGDLPETLRGLVPVRLVLRKVVHVPQGAEGGQAKMLWDALEEDVKGRMGTGYGAAWEWLQKEIRDGRSLILLDGLDEVPEAGEQRSCLLQAVEGFLKGLPEMQRVVLTARPYAYLDPDWQLKGCQVFNLAPLNAEQVGLFVKRWYSSVRRSIDLDEKEAEQRATQLAVAIEASSYLADLASRPLLLTQMAMVHSAKNELPEDRADLYERTVDLLLVRWQRSGIGSVLRVGGQVDLSLIQSVLAELAYQTHVRQRGMKEVEGPGDIPFGELLAVFVKRLPQILPADLTAYLENRTGLLVEREPGLYCFAHRSFQEYLAACHLVNTSLELSSDLRKLVDEDAAWWREVILLAVGKTRRGSMTAALDLLRNVLLPVGLDECPMPSVSDWRAAALDGLGLVELRVRERQPELAEAPRNLPRARRWLVALMEKSSLPARERVEAGNALAALGDPRFDPEMCYLPKDSLLGFIWISGGVFRMGSVFKLDPESMPRERPQHRVEVSEYYIQRYPVTVAQFGAFVKQSGYGLKIPEGVANHPVVNVTWHDAMAYCAWLDNWLREKGPGGLRSRLVGGWHVTLPSEAEWEMAARGQDGIENLYPWGKEFDRNKANTRESGIGGTSPVENFPEGAGHNKELMDMSGNVWEWCADWFDEEAYNSIRSDRDPLGPDKGEGRTLRGGSWALDRGDARCASRNKYAPTNYNFDIGFRVVISPVLRNKTSKE